MRTSLYCRRGNASQSQLTQFCRNSLLTLSNDTSDSKQPSTSSSLIVLENRHPLKRRLLAAAENDEPKPSTSKLAKLASEVFQFVHFNSVFFVCSLIYLFTVNWKLLYRT